MIDKHATPERCGFLSLCYVFRKRLSFLRFYLGKHLLRYSLRIATAFCQYLVAPRNIMLFVNVGSLNCNSTFRFSYIEFILVSGIDLGVLWYREKLL